jgi:hypothetical protein
MTNTERLQQKLNALPEDEREAMAAHLLTEWEEQQWDKQIEADYEAGKLDAFIQKAEDDIATGRTYPLP